MKLIEELGKRRMLTVVKTVDFGIYLGTSEERVLLPKKEVPKEIEIGDPVEVFLYKDSSDRLIATTAEPKITLGELAGLTVKDTGKIGAFLDWGLPKDLLLPFKEQTAKVKKGDQVLVALYVDKSKTVILLILPEYRNHVRTTGKYFHHSHWIIIVDRPGHHSNLEFTIIRLTLECSPLIEVKLNFYSKNFLPHLLTICCISSCPLSCTT